MKTARKATSKNALCLIIVLALSVRLINYVGPVRGDDFRYLALAYDAQFGAINMSFWSAADRVALYMPISWLYRLFGVNEWTSVAFPLLASLATIFFILLIGKHLKDTETGLVAALMWAVFPLDVINATQVLPDAILAAYVAGATLLLLKGLHAHGWRRAALWSGCLLLSALAFFTKDIGLLNGLFCAATVVLYLARGKLAEFWTWVNQARARQVGFGLAVLLATLAVILNSEKLIVFPDGRTLTLLAQNATDFFEAILLGVAPFGYAGELPGRVELFDLVMIAFLIALTAQSLQREKRILFPLIWLGFLFIASEWGTEATRLPIYYSTPDPKLVVDRRHLLYMMIPVVLVVGSFFSKALATNRLRKLTWLVLGLAAVSLLVQNTFWSAELIPWLERVFVIAILAALSLPLLSRRTDLGIGARCLQLNGLALFLFAALLPMGRYHVSDWNKEQALMANLRQTADYLKNTAAKGPIITIPGNTQRLNYASDFELGFNWGSIDYQYPNARITRASSQSLSDQDHYIVFEDVGGDRHTHLISPEWEPLITFGEGGPSAVTIYLSRATDGN